MRVLLSHLLLLTGLALSVHATIFQNQQVRSDPYPGQASLVTATNSSVWRTYSPNATEISYKGRWDSQYISWWSAPGIKFGFTGQNVALSFGRYTDQGVLLAWRLDGQDWQFANVTANATYQFVSGATTGSNLTQAGLVQTFEMRITNWGYGVQLTGVKVDANERLIQLPNYSKTIEIIGDSLSSGYTATYEGISSWAWGFTEGLGNVEFSITVGPIRDSSQEANYHAQAFPGICLYDQECFGNPRGQTYQWYRTSDTSGRAQQLYGDNPPEWNFAAHSAADLVVINIGTNGLQIYLSIFRRYPCLCFFSDNNTANNVSTTDYYNSYIELIDGIHRTWPNAQIILHVSSDASRLLSTFRNVLTYLPITVPMDWLWSYWKHFLSTNTAWLP